MILLSWFCRSILLCLVFSISAFSIELPRELRDLLLQKNRGDLIEYFQSLKLKNNSEIIDSLSNKPLQFLGSGFNGVGFQTDKNVVYKVAHHVISSSYKDHLLWRAFLEKQAALKHLRIEHNFNVGASRRELFGNLLWAVYTTKPADSKNKNSLQHDFLPLELSEDTMVAARSLQEGDRLSDLLKKQAAGEAIPYNFESIWKKVSEYQRLSEKMLLETGVTVDLLNSGNFLISGDFENPTVKLLDHELIRPSKETFEYYKKLGKKINNTAFALRSEDFVYWPLVPEQIVFNNNWALTLDQAVDFIKVYFGYQTRQAALLHLAETPEYPIEFVPIVQNYESQRQARAAICESALFKM